MNKKKYIILTIVSVLSFILITAGVTYAFFSYIGEGSTDNTIESGSINFIYEEVNKMGNGISITDALPVSDSEGKASNNYFDFKVTSSTGTTIAIPYEITTRVVDGSDDLSDYVKLYLTKVNGTNEQQVALSVYSNLSDSTNTLASTYNDKTLYKGEIPVGVTNYIENYRLRMWLNDNSTDGSVLDYSPVYQCSDTNYTNQTDCESNNGVWNPTENYNNQNKTFSIKVNVYANGEQATSEKIALANSIGIENISAGSQDAIENTDTSKNYDYYLEVSEGTTELDVDVNTSNSYASVDIVSVTESEANTLKQLSTSKKLNLIDGDNYFKITVTSQNRNNTENYILKVHVPESLTSWNFDFDPDGDGKGQVQTFNVPKTGTYKLEVWGAQGGSFDSTYHGGYGGYSVGTIRLDKNDIPILYIVVGGSGSYGAKAITGGYNGGGDSYGSAKGTASGGGATHIATITGVLSSLENNQESILIVAGGGGAAYNENSSNCGYGGAGGGTTGLASPNTISTRTYKTPSTGGTQSSGGTYGIYYNSSYNGLGNLSNGSFGQGGKNQSTGSDTRVCGGGGGYYGGGATYQGAAAGGSSYIGGVTSGQTIDGDSSMPTHDGTSTMIGNTGNGYAKITYIDE